MALCLGLFVGGAPLHAIGQTTTDGESNRAPRLAPHIEAILRLIPGEAPLAIIVPNLKAASDELTRLTEGMDRANLLLGLRPLDHLKSATGFNTGINDLGAAAQIRLAPYASKRSVMLIPVTDSQAFIKGNFTGSKDGVHLRGDGTAWHVKELGSHVAVSATAGVVEEVGGAAEQPSMIESLSGRVIELLNAADAIALLEPRAIIEIGVSNAAIPEDEKRKILQRPVATTASFVTFDFDPLALVARSFVAFKPDSDEARLLVGGENRGVAMNALPDKPYYMAAAADMRGAGGADVFLGWLGSMIGQPVPNLEQLAAFDRLQFAAYPSPAGLAGGLLNDAALIIESSPPAAALEAVKALVQDAPKFRDGVKREVKWEDAREVKDVGSAAAYEIKNIDVPPALAQQQMIAGMIYGRTGLRGFVKPTETGAIVTFSQRPAVLKAAVDAANGTLGKDGGADGGLAGNAVIRSMREWMPTQADAIGFVDVGQLLKFVLTIADSFGMRDAIPLPPLDDSLPPIGFAMEVGDGAMEGTMIMPAGVVAVLADLGFKTTMQVAEPMDPAPAEAGDR